MHTWGTKSSHGEVHSCRKLTHGTKTKKFYFWITIEDHLVYLSSQLWSLHLRSMYVLTQFSKVPPFGCPVSQKPSNWRCGLGGLGSCQTPSSNWSTMPTQMMMLPEKDDQTVNIWWAGILPDACMHFSWISLITRSSIMSISSWLFSSLDYIKKIYESWPKKWVSSIVIRSHAWVNKMSTKKSNYRHRHQSTEIIAHSVVEMEVERIRKEVETARSFLLPFAELKLGQSFYRHISQYPVRFIPLNFYV